MAKVTEAYKWTFIKLGSPNAKNAGTHKFIVMQLFTNAAAALPCEMEDGKCAEESQGSGNPLQMLIPSKIAMSLRSRMARNRRQVPPLPMQEDALEFKIAIQDRTETTKVR